MNYFLFLGVENTSLAPTGPAYSLGESLPNSPERTWELAIGEVLTT